MANDEHSVNRGLLIGPNVNTGAWTPEMVWNTGFVDSYSSNLAYLAVEQRVANPPSLFTFGTYGLLNLVTQPTIALLNMASALQETRKPHSLISSIIPRVRQLFARTLIPPHMHKPKGSSF